MFLNKIAKEKNCPLFFVITVSPHHFNKKITVQRQDGAG